MHLREHGDGFGIGLHCQRLQTHLHDQRQTKQGKGGRHARHGGGGARLSNCRGARPSRELLQCGREAAQRNPQQRVVQPIRQFGEPRRPLPQHGA